MRKQIISKLSLVFLTLTVTALFLTPKAQANVLFEGWFEVYKGAKKIGFVVERYEFTGGKFKCVYYLKTNAEGNSVTESVKAFAKNDLTPLSYAYTTKVGDTIKVIDATFKGDTEKLEIFDGKKKTKKTDKVKKGTFLSQFLMYLILQQPDGLKAGKDYSYFAIAEEDGVTYKGDALVKGEEDVKGKLAFKILNEFKGEKFFTWVTAKGEPLLTRSPENNIDVRFADRDEAMKGIMTNLQDIRLLFGNVPGGEGNLSNKAEADSGEGTNLKSGGGKTSGADKPGGDEKSKTAKPGKTSTESALPPNGSVEIKGVKPPPTSGPDTNSAPAPNSPPTDGK